MAAFFTMPKLGMNMIEGNIVGWLVKEGDRVEEGQPILEIETDKATNEVESPASGVIGKILHQVGEVVACNGVLAVILDEGEALPDEIPAMIGEDVAPKSDVSGTAVEKAQADAGGSPQSSSGRIRVSPSAKKLAKELGVDLADVTASGSQIKREDVQRAYDAGLKKNGKPAPAHVSARAYSGMRKLTGDAMAVSAAKTAAVPLFLEANAEGLMKQRESYSQGGKKVSFNILLAKIAAQALKAHPYMNIQLSGEQIWEYEAVNIGIAVNSEKGLYVPVLRDVDKKEIASLQSEFDGLAARTLEGKATSQDLSDGTFTITNLGAQGIESFVPVINLPQCSILGVGAIIEKPVVADGKVIPQKRIGLTLVFDHRLVDGEPAAKFLQSIKTAIEELDQ